jgi:hypothetical protein
VLDETERGWRRAYSGARTPSGRVARAEMALSLLADGCELADLEDREPQRVDRRQRIAA